MTEDHFANTKWFWNPHMHLVLPNISNDNMAETQGRGEYLQVINTKLGSFWNVFEGLRAQQRTDSSPWVNRRRSWVMNWPNPPHPALSVGRREGLEENALFYFSLPSSDSVNQKFEPVFPLECFFSSQSLFQLMSPM